MNFRNIYQDKVQSAYWDGTQTAIHAIINYFLCPVQGCNENVTLVIAQITDDHLHDSFVARAGHDAAFKYLAQLNVPMDLIIQFCDNCSSQYKSRRPFVEMARCALNIMRIYFGEKHGKSQCDGFFGCLKSWMTYKIKSRQVVITNATDFFRYCRQEYETQAAPEGTCQHYRVIFQYLRPSDIRRHQDCDLDKCVPGTLGIYSVRNTPHPLKLQIRTVPCLCKQCISGNGENCDNSEFTDPWREVDLIPVKGESTQKRQKRKHPKDTVRPRVGAVSANTNGEDNEPEENIENPLADEELPDVVIEGQDDSQYIDLTEENHTAMNEDLFIDLTEADGTDDAAAEIVHVNVEEEEVIIEKKSDKNKQSIHTEEDDTVPEQIFWESVLASIERCTNPSEMLAVVNTIQGQIEPIRERKSDIYFNCALDYIHATAKSLIPPDLNMDLDPIWIPGDGNCFTRSVGKGYSGTEDMHVELRARIVIKGILNKSHYLDSECMNRGANSARLCENLPEVYSKYSDYYVNGQRITENTVDYIYTQEIHECSRLGSFMGLWQFAQAATVLNTPIQSVFPECGDPLMRQDFNRTFFPLNYNPKSQVEPIRLLWTSTHKESCELNHFVPLLPKRNKYGKRYF